MSTLKQFHRLVPNISRGVAHRTFGTISVLHEKLTLNVKGQGEGVAQQIDVTGSPHKVSVDTYKSFGGAESAPSPLAYNLSSLASCTQVTGSIVANDIGIKLGKWDVDVSGTLDPAVLVEGKQGNGNWSGLQLKVVLETNATKTQFEQFTSETERRCPITQLFKKSGVDWESSWENKSL